MKMNFEKLKTLPGVEKKINEYVDRIRSGEEKSLVLQGLGPSFISAVEAQLALLDDVRVVESSELSLENRDSYLQKKEEEKQEDEYQIQEIRKKLFESAGVSVPEKHIEVVSHQGIDSIKPIINAIGTTHYLFTHQTAGEVAKKIFETNFRFSPGTGFSGTASWLGAQGVTNQIERQLQGDAHRGADGMVIIAVPKELLDNLAGRNKSEALEEYLMEQPDYGKDGTGDIVIPQEFNFGFLQGDVLFQRKSFENIKKQPIQEEIHTTEKTEEWSSQEIFKIKGMITPVVVICKQLEETLDDRSRKTGDPMFRDIYLDEMHEYIQDLENLSTKEELLDKIAAFSELFRKMINGKNYYNIHEDYNGSKAEELKNIEIVLDDFTRTKEAFLKIRSDIPYFGEKEQLLDQAFKSLLFSLMELTDGIDTYRDLLQNK